MIVSTTNVIEGKTVKEYLGVVSGDAIEGSNVVKDMMASVRDFVGGRSATYEKVLDEARAAALFDLQQKAGKLGANAIIGLSLDYCIIRDSMMLVTTTGTAVVVE